MMESEDTLVGFVCRSLKTKKSARQFGVLREGNDGDILVGFMCGSLKRRERLGILEEQGFAFPYFFLGFP